MWLQKDQQFSKCGRKSHIWLREPSLWPWTWRQQINLLAGHSGPWWSIIIPSLVTKGSAVEEILTLTTTEQSNLFTRQSRLWWCATKPHLAAKGSAVQKIYWKSSYDHLVLHCDFDLENSKPIFLLDTSAHDASSWCCITISSLVYKKKCLWILKTIWTNIDILTLHCDLDLECRNPYFFSKDTLAYEDVSSDQVWLPNK